MSDKVKIKIKTKKSNKKSNKTNKIEETLEQTILTKVNNFVNNERVEPLNWVLPNKKEFTEWVTTTFSKYRISEKIGLKQNGFKPYNYQKLLRDYMQNNSPYRGILLYHGLGSGKTCSSILIAENLKSTRNVIVMLPASLRTNFIQEGLMFCGSQGYKNGTVNYQNHYNFISYNANNTIAQIKKLGSLDFKVIIIEEVHNLVSKIVNSINGISKQGMEIYQMLMNAQNVKIVALSGTPLINNPLEAAVLFNILRGWIEITYYRIMSVSPKYGDKWNFEELEKEIRANENIDYLEINKINKSFEFHIKPKSYQQEYRDTCDFIDKTCYKNGVSVRYLELLKVPLFPIDDDGQVFRNYFVNENDEKGDSLKNEQIFKQRILGLVSHYESKNTEEYPEIMSDQYFRVEMSNYQLQMYELLRIKERLTERGGKSKQKKGKGTVKSNFRVFSRQACNFVFPEGIPRPYPDPSFVVSLAQRNNRPSAKTNAKSLKDIENMLTKEERANNQGNIAPEYKRRIDMAIEKLVENGMNYLKPVPDGLNKLSPKMSLLLTNMESCTGLIFVYSNFRTLEGIEVFTKILDFNGYSHYTTQDDVNKKYAIYSGAEKEEERKKMLAIFTSHENKHGQFIKVLLATAAGAEGLDLKNIRQIHIMEPYWNQMRNRQVIGRGVRRNSHIDLPKNERKIEIFRYVSVFSKTNSILTKDKISTDQYINQNSIKRQYIIDQMLTIFKECSFDCFLNYDSMNRDYRCFQMDEKNKKGFSYYPMIAKDLVTTVNTTLKEPAERILTPGVYYNGQIYLYDQSKKVFHLYHDKTKTAIKINLKEANPLYIDKAMDVAFKKKKVDQGDMSEELKITKNGKLRR